MSSKPVPHRQGPSLLHARLVARLLRERLLPRPLRARVVGVQAQLAACVPLLALIAAAVAAGAGRRWE